MATIVTRGIVLRCANYRDHDRMLTVLTPDSGCIDALSRGCKRPKSPLMPASELFVTGEYTFFRGTDRALLTSCSVEETFYPLRLDPYRLTCASYMASLCRAAAVPGQDASQLYALLLKGLYSLSYEPDADALAETTAFLLLFCDVCGYRPRLTRCVHCRSALSLDGDSFFDSHAGGLCCPDCASSTIYRLTHDQVVWISRTLREGNLTQKEPVSPELFEMLRRYAEERLETPIAAGKMLP